MRAASWELFARLGELPGFFSEHLMGGPGLLGPSGFARPAFRRRGGFVSRCNMGVGVFFFFLSPDKGRIRRKIYKPYRVSSLVSRHFLGIKVFLGEQLIR